MYAFRMLLIDALEVYKWILIAAVIISWLYAFNIVNRSNAFVYRLSDILDRLTEPVLRPIRNLLPNLGGIDISPIILILLIVFLQRLIATGF